MRKVTVVAVSVALAAIGLSACSSSTGTSLGANKQGTASEIPWSSVGPRWSLATFTTTPATAAEPAPPQAPTQLFLVNGVGGRYKIAEFPGEAVLVQDWLANARRALVSMTKTCTGCDQQSINVVNLNSGALLTQWSLPSNTTVDPTSIGFLNATGRTLLGNVSNQSQPYCTLHEYSPTGTSIMAFPNTFSDAGNYTCFRAVSHSGLEIAVGAAKGVVLLSAGGAVRRQFIVPATFSGCTPRKWWSSTELLLYCTVASTSTEQILTMSTASGKLTPLAHAPKQPDNGDIDAWSLSAGLFGQSLGGCGYEYLSKRGTDGYMSKVDVPGVPSGNSVFVLGASSRSLLLHATLACSLGESLLWYTPSTGATTVVLGPPLTGGSVIDAVAYRGAQ